MAPRTERCIAEMRARWIRQMEGGRSLDVESPGGKRNEGLSQVVEEKRSEDFGVDESRGEGGIFGGEPIEIEEAFEAFENELNLPSESVDFEDTLGRECFGVE